MEIIVGRWYILCNVFEGGFGGCQDIVDIVGESVLVYEKHRHPNSTSFHIRDKHNETHVCEAINLKPISINRRIE